MKEPLRRRTGGAIRTEALDFMTDDSDTPLDPAGTAGLTDLAAIRARIDAIDEEMHTLLIERSSIIDALIKVKRAAQTGVAFRPGREAAMMHRFAARHHGSLPLTTVENLWREIISTFTWLQAPYRVHIPVDGDIAAIQDTLRFYFGFTVPYDADADADAVVAAVAGSRSDLGLVPLGDASASWWSALGGAGPRIIARLPFYECEGRPAATPTVVISNPLDEQAEPELLCWATTWPAGSDATKTLDGTDITVIATHRGEDTVSALLAADRALDEKALARRLADAGATPPRAVGGYAAPLAITDTDPTTTSNTPAATPRTES